MYEETESIGEMAKETLRLTRENNKILKAMRRDAFIHGVIRIVIWLVIFAGGYYITMTYLAPLLNMFTGAAEMRPEDFQRLFEQYREQFGM
ncbi:hypothetical protein K2Y00_01430 [Patescibacteria group bacterium]|nr:hypothetical protein [Patescibacteria group bacterium]